LKFDPLVISSVENQKDLGRPLALEVDTPGKIHKTPFKNLIDGDFQLRGSIISWGLSNFPGCRSRQGALAVAMGSLGAFEMGLGSQ
jgi:hypothetical protein